MLITGIRALPPTRRKWRNAARLSLFDSGVLQGKHAEEIRDQMRKWKIWSKKKTISFERSVVKLVLPQQSQSSRDMLSGWLGGGTVLQRGHAGFEPIADRYKKVVRVRLYKSTGIKG